MKPPNNIIQIQSDCFSSLAFSGSMAIPRLISSGLQCGCLCSSCHLQMTQTRNKKGDHPCLVSHFIREETFPQNTSASKLSLPFHCSFHTRPHWKQQFQTTQLKREMALLCSLELTAQWVRDAIVCLRDNFVLFSFSLSLSAVPFQGLSSRPQTHHTPSI